jgi:hypothetical protein
MQKTTRIGDNLAPYQSRMENIVIESPQAYVTNSRSDDKSPKSLDSSKSSDSARKTVSRTRSFSDSSLNSPSSSSGSIFKSSSSSLSIDRQTQSKSVGIGIFSKKTSKSSQSQSYPEEKKIIGEKEVEQWTLANVPLKMLQEDEADDFEKKLKLNKLAYSENCTTHKQLEQKIEELFNQMIQKQALPSLFLYPDKTTADRCRTLDIIKNIQNELIASTSIYSRLKECQKVLDEYLIQNKSYTLSMKLLHETLKKLSDCAEPKNLVPEQLVNNNNNNNNKLPTTGLSDFVACVKEVQKYKKVKPVVLKILGDEKKIQESVIQILKDWANTEKRSKEYLEKIRSDTLDFIVKNIFKMEHLWSEPIEYEHAKFPNIDNISANEIIQSFAIHRIPLNIDGLSLGGEKDFTRNVTVENFTAPLDFLIKIISNFYTALNFTIIDKDKIKKEMNQLFRLENWEKGDFSDETNQCLRLLKMGCAKTSLRSDYYLKCRLQAWFGDSFSLESEREAINFYFDRQKHERPYVEHVLKYKTKIGQNCYSFPVSFKLFFPKQEETTWDCVMQFQKSELLKIGEIFNFSTDDVVQEEIPGIKISHRIL